jgi:hypothetical protein
MLSRRQFSHARLPPALTLFLHRYQVSCYDHHNLPHLLRSLCCLHHSGLRTLLIPLNRLPDPLSFSVHGKTPHHQPQVGTRVPSRSTHIPHVRTNRQQTTIPIMVLLPLRRLLPPGIGTPQELWNQLIRKLFLFIWVSMLVQYGCLMVKHPHPT